MRRRNLQEDASKEPAGGTIGLRRGLTFGVTILTVALVVVVASSYHALTNGASSRSNNKGGVSSASLILFTNSRGAKESSKSTSSNQCDPSQLTTVFWTTLPEGPGIIYSGFTIVNSGTSSCTLPEELTDLTVANSADSATAFSGFSAPNPIPTYSDEQVPDSTSSTSSPEFANIGLINSSGEATIKFGASDTPVQIDPIVLAPSGSAVVVIESLFGVNSDQPNCLSVPASDGLDVGIPSGDFFVNVPTMPAPGGAGENPNSSAFYECATSSVSPFVTWSQAVQMVGGPGLLIGPQGPVPGADNAILSLAP